MSLVTTIPSKQFLNELIEWACVNSYGGPTARRYLGNPGRSESDFNPVPLQPSSTRFIMKKMGLPKPLSFRLP